MPLPPASIDAHGYLPDLADEGGTWPPEGASLAAPVETLQGPAPYSACRRPARGSNRLATGRNSIRRYALIWIRRLSQCNRIGTHPHLDNTYRAITFYKLMT